MTASDVMKELYQLQKLQEETLKAIQELNKRMDLAGIPQVQKQKQEQEEVKETPKFVAKEVSSEELEIQVTEAIQYLGVPAHIKGYQYMRTSIMMLIEDPTLIHSITKILYPTIAKQYQTTPSRVERAIRHAVEVSFARKGYEAEQEIFRNTIDPNKGKPTNSEFLAIVADKIRMENRMSAEK